MSKDVKELVKRLRVFRAQLMADLYAENIIEVRVIHDAITALSQGPDEVLEEAAQVADRDAQGWGNLAASAQMRGDFRTANERAGRAEACRSTASLIRALKSPTAQDDREAQTQWTDADADSVSTPPAPVETFSEVMSRQFGMDFDTWVSADPHFPVNRAGCSDLAYGIRAWIDAELDRRLSNGGKK